MAGKTKTKAAKAKKQALIEPGGVKKKGPKPTRQALEQQSADQAQELDQLRGQSM